MAAHPVGRALIFKHPREALVFSPRAALGTAVGAHTLPTCCPSWDVYALELSRRTGRVRTPVPAIRVGSNGVWLPHALAFAMRHRQGTVGLVGAELSKGAFCRVPRPQSWQRIAQTAEGLGSDVWDQAWGLEPIGELERKDVDRNGEEAGASVRGARAAVAGAVGHDQEDDRGGRQEGGPRRKVANLAPCGWTDRSATCPSSRRGRQT